MPFSKKNTKEFFLNLYNYFHSLENEERIRYAAYRLNKMIIAEGITHNRLNRFHMQSTSPYSPPNSTPEEAGVQKFLQYRDRLVLQASELEPTPDQDIIHEKCLETNDLKLGFKYSRKWLKSAKIDSKATLASTKSENYEKKRVISKVAPLGIGSSKSFRIGATGVSSVGGGSLASSKYVFGDKRVGFEDEIVISTKSYESSDKKENPTPNTSSEKASKTVVAPVVQDTINVTVVEAVSSGAGTSVAVTSRSMTSRARTSRTVTSREVTSKTVTLGVENIVEDKSETPAAGECSHRLAAENICPAATPEDCRCPKPTICLCPKSKPKSFRRWFF